MMKIEDAIALSKRHGFMHPEEFSFRYGGIDDTRNSMLYLMNMQLGDNGVWLPEYEAIAEWLSDNKGKGLLISGNNGVGKTFMLRSVVIPLFIQCTGFIPIWLDTYSTPEEYESVINQRYKFIAIDDVGAGPAESVMYGNRRVYFPEIMDVLEKNGGISFITTNKEKDELDKMYGTRAIERIMARTKRIAINGGSFRRKIRI